MRLEAAFGVADELDRETGVTAPGAGSDQLRLSYGENTDAVSRTRYSRWRMNLNGSEDYRPGAGMMKQVEQGVGKTVLRHGLPGRFVGMLKRKHDVMKTTGVKVTLLSLVVSYSCALQAKKRVAGDTAVATGQRQVRLHR